MLTANDDVREATNYAHREATENQIFCRGTPMTYIPGMSFV
jgi:hypothetical protein